MKPISVTRHLSFILVFFAALLASCSPGGTPPQAGTWRATLKTEAGVEIPFNFLLSDSAGTLSADILNGEERLRIDDIRQEGDSVILKMPLFDSEIRTRSKGKSLDGFWVKHLAGKDVQMPFHAEAGTSWRFFKVNSAPEPNIEGRWSAVFTSADGKDTTLAVAEFQQRDHQVTGTFLTTTGDYRFLQGSIADGKLFLSCFDGSHAFLFTGLIRPDHSIAGGKFYSGISSVDNWTAVKDEKAMLPDAYSLTVLKPGYSKIDFSFPDLEGNNVSLADERFKNKVVIVQFMGSWCPNCMDETAYLVPLYGKYHDQGLEVLGLAYERFTDTARARKNVGQLKDHFKIPYPLLITGYPNDKQQVAASIPALQNFLAFPTTIVIDKKGSVRKIHTGFSGPGTGAHYTEFSAEFEDLIRSLLAEK